MSIFRWVSEGASLAFAVGVFFILYSTLRTLVDTLANLWRRMFASWTTLRLHDLGILREEKSRQRLAVDWARILIFIAILLIAAAVHDALLSPLILLFGMAAFAWSRYQAGEAQRMRVNEDAELGTLQMRSLLNVDHSLLNALNGLELPDGALRNAIRDVAARLQMHQQPEQSALALKELPGTVTARLAALIANSARITDEVQMDLFQELEGEAHRQKLIRSKMRQTLALVKGTIRLLQGVAAAATVFVLMAPDWRAFFLQDIPHRTLLTGLLFVEDLMAQHLAHKTVLSVLAWFTYGGLLLGRWRFGLRGMRAVRWVLVATVFLSLAYLGSKFVLEILLQRT